MTETLSPATTPLVARVAVDVALPHLDRPFDYLVPDSQREAAAVGVRVRVRFAGKLRDGFVVGLSETSDADVELKPLERVMSSEVVLTPAIATLCRAVADHYAGTFSDVVRMAVPGRHAATEAAAPIERPQRKGGPQASVLTGYVNGRAFLDGLEQGRPLRAAWGVVPVFGGLGDWAGGLLEAAASTLASGRGVLIVVPDADALAHLAARCEATFGRGTFVALSAEVGPAARYRSFLAAARGDVRIVLGTRNAVYAPVHDLGLLAIWDDGNDSLSEPRAPYPHVRAVAALRVSEEKCALLVAGHARTAETQALVERGWLASIDLPPSEIRRLAPVVRIAADTDLALERDPLAHAARLPHDVFAAIRRALASGPVLLQVPRAGYVSSLSCERCREPARCPRCGRVLRGDRGGSEGRGSDGVREVSGGRVDRAGREADMGRGGSEAGGLRLVCGLCGPLGGAWRCPNCGDTHLRAPRVGVARTAEEFGRAFPQTAVLLSWSGHLLDAVGEEPALVLATPGAEPTASHGYAAAILLDAGLLLARPELRASEEALRRWLAVSSLVRGASEGGSVLAVGETDARALQALVRLDPAGFAQRELAERRATGFPPAAKLALIEGPRTAVDTYEAACAAVPGAELFGPAMMDGELWRLTVRTPLASAPALLAVLREESARRSAHKVVGAVRVRVDPQVIE